VPEGATIGCPVPVINPSRASAPIPMPQPLAMTGVTPSRAFWRDAMLPHENNSVPKTAQPIPRSVSLSGVTTISCQNSSTRPQRPIAPARTVRPVTGSPKISRAFSALKIEASEKITETSPDGIRAAALYSPTKLKQNRHNA